MFRLRMLPAGDGDCLVLSWGDGGLLHHMVIDGGRRGAYARLSDELRCIADAGEELVLYVLTHVDADHIEGSLAYLDDVNRPLLPKDVWFNGYAQMVEAGVRSTRQGDEWSKAVARLQLPLNRHFGNGVASIDHAPAEIDIAGLKVTMLSPDVAHLARMGDLWRREREPKRPSVEGMRGSRDDRPPPKQPIIVEDLVADGPIDPEKPNGSSIAFLAEWQGRRVLLGGDAHPDVLAASVARLAAEDGGRPTVHVYKASHHGSRKNTTKELIELLECCQLAVSTNGTHHGHPDPESIARFLHFGPDGPKTLHFNYATDYTIPWADPALGKAHGFIARMPEDEPGALEIDLMSDPSAP